MSLQEKIDSRINDAKKPLLRAVIEGESGDANVPANVNVDFRDCTIGKLTTAGNSRINIEKGSLAEGNLTGTAIIVRDATISGKVTAKDSKLEYSGVTVQDKQTLDGSTLSSKHSTYSGDLAFALSNASRARSTADKFTGTRVATVDGSFTTLDIINPTIDSTNIGDVTGQAMLTIDGGTIQCSDTLGTINGAMVEIRNCTSLQGKSFFTLEGGVVRFRKMLTVTATEGGFIGNNGALIEVLDVRTIETGEVMFSLDNGSRLDVVRFDTLSANNDVLRFGLNCAGRIANGLTLVTTTELGTMDHLSRLLIDKVQTVKGPKMIGSGTGSDITLSDIASLIIQDQGFDLKSGSSLTLNGIAQTTTNGKMANLSDSSATLKDCALITGQNGPFLNVDNHGSIHISGTSRANIVSGDMITTTGVVAVTLTGNVSLTAAGRIVFMTAQGGSVLNASSCQVIQSSGAVTFDLVGTDAFLTALPNLSNGDGSVTCVRGRPGTAGQQQIVVSKCVVTGFDLQEYSCDLFATTFGKYHFNDCDIRSRRCIQSVSGLSTSDALFLNCAHVDMRSEWNNAIHIQSGTGDFQRSRMHDNFVTKDAVLRTDVIEKMSNVGIVPEGGDSRGSSVFCMGWTPDAVTGSNSNKDAFDLRTMGGTPSYSGPGGLFVMTDEPCGLHKLNYIRIKYDDIRILDSRNEYEDFAAKIVRHSDTDINDDASQRYTLKCNNATELADTNFDITGSERLTGNSDASIVLTAPEIDEES